MRFHVSAWSAFLIACLIACPGSVLNAQQTAGSDDGSEVDGLEQGYPNSIRPANQPSSIGASDVSSMSEFYPDYYAEEYFPASVKVGDLFESTSTSSLQQATMLQITPFVEPPISALPEIGAPLRGEPLATRLQQGNGLEPPLPRFVLASSIFRPNQLDFKTVGGDVVSGEEAGPLVTKDLGSLIDKSRNAPSASAQRRTPIINDTRIRGSRVGSLAASGSYWIPAREDLDTAMSKIDSRLVQDVLIIPGPYSSLYGPGFQFVDFELLKSPRSESGLDWHGRSSFDHNSNGNQWLARQGLWGGGEDWGVRADYAYRTGSDYRTGSGNKIAGSYESREITLALGRDFGDGRSIELSLLRLDQSNVEFPGYVFDIDYLKTDAYEITYTDDHASFSDRAETDIWYNRTVFEGDSFADSKNLQFPQLEALQYKGVTDVDSLSTGYRHGNSWGTPENYVVTIGHDLRLIKQELNEISSGQQPGGGLPISDQNSPIPRSFSVNPGLFFEYRESLLDRYTFRTGGRIDYVQTDIIDDQAKLTSVGFGDDAGKYQEIIGTDQTQTDRIMGSLYTGLDRRFNDSLSGSVSLGFAQRPPTLTELYAAGTFLLLLQNGLNSVTGDPRLSSEKLIQTDISLDYEGDHFRGGVRGFYGWSFDYITLENTATNLQNANSVPQQVDLRYVNTALATLVGGEAYAELFPKARLTPFLTAQGMDGRDRTRNGDFATSEGGPGKTSTQETGVARGFFSSIVGNDSEPLPGISPFTMRVGARLRDDAKSPQWNLELAARIVDNQDRVASSLLEYTTPGFTVWDLRGVYRPTQIAGFTLVAGIENFTDKAYREHLDFRSPNGSILQPGVNVYVGCDWLY
ncbi:TonB-dependent receptor domain-containing protein [Novipirellula sp. SH528]|uniref:TonB-dependent receptor domain-containing protein n=1 Tax=Novipirellula sp. SH528 TaxID=3454466 RepID=UPI003F9FBAFD